MKMFLANNTKMPKNFFFEKCSFREATPLYRLASTINVVVAHCSFELSICIRNVLFGRKSCM